jgi:hypothetical protein
MLTLLCSVYITYSFLVPELVSSELLLVILMWPNMAIDEYNAVYR